MLGKLDGCSFYLSLILKSIKMGTNIREEKTKENKNKISETMEIITIIVREKREK